MALIECPECGREVSESAAACPECAYPVGRSTGGASPSVVSESRGGAWWPTASIIGRIAVGGILMFLARVESELGAGTGLLGLLVAGSAIPTWYRHKLERLRAGWADPTVIDDLEGRVVELEHRNVELEHRQMEQMSELAERVEFAERLLAKQRDQIGPG